MNQLSNFFIKYGINTLTNFDLYNVSKDIGIRIKIIMRDEIEKNIEFPIIFNYQSSENKGTHWCSFYNGFYFDSFGIPPIKELENVTKKYNKLQIQPFVTEICGILSIYFLYCLIIKKLTFEETINKMKKEMELFLENL